MTFAKMTKLTTNYKNEDHLEHFNKMRTKKKQSSRKLGPKKYLRLINNIYIYSN